MNFNSKFAARRRVAAKRKKLKNLGKSKSTDTEDEDADEDCGDEGELQFNFHCVCHACLFVQFSIVNFFYLWVDALDFNHLFCLKLSLFHLIDDINEEIIKAETWQHNQFILSQFYLKLSINNAFWISYVIHSCFYSA